VQQLAVATETTKMQANAKGMFVVCSRTASIKARIAAQTCLKFFDTTGDVL
jgi:hypothetical protein